MPRLPADNRTPLRKWIVQQFKALLPNPTDVTKVSLDDAGSARAWGHCTIRGCTATVSCAVNIQLDHVFITCFQRGVHSHLLAVELDRNAALDLAACVSHKSPKKGRAELLARKPAVPICNLPTRKEHKRARRCFLKKQPKRMASTCHAALSWQQRLADRAANGAAFSQDGFLFYPFCGLDDTLETLSHWGRLANLQVPPHSYVFMSRYMVDFTRAYIAAGGVRSFKQGVLLGNFTWMPSYSGYAIGLWAHASQHTYSAGKSAQHLPKSQAIPAAYQWVPRNTMHAEVFGLITLVLSTKNIMALILVHCYQRSCWMAACLGTTLFNKYFLQGRSSLGICRINQELSLLKTMIAVPLIRNVESGDDIVILDQTGCV